MLRHIHRHNRRIRLRQLSIVSNLPLIKTLMRLHHRKLIFHGKHISFQLQSLYNTQAPLLEFRTAYVRKDPISKLVAHQIVNYTKHVFSLGAKSIFNCFRNLVLDP